MQKIRYVFLSVAIGLLIIQFYVADYSDFWKWGTILNILVPMLLMGSLSANIYVVKR